MTPETIEVLKGGLIFTGVLTAAGIAGYMIHRVLQAFDHIEQIRDHTKAAWHDAEHTRYDTQSIERHICRRRCGNVCIYEREGEQG